MLYTIEEKVSSDRMVSGPFLPSVLQVNSIELWALEPLYVPSVTINWFLLNRKKAAFTYFYKALSFIIYIKLLCFVINIMDFCNIAVINATRLNQPGKNKETSLQFLGFMADGNLKCEYHVKNYLKLNSREMLKVISRCNYVFL